MHDDQVDGPATVKPPHIRKSSVRFLPKLLRRFLKDRSGNYVIMFALALPALVGFSAFGTEEGLLLYKRQAMQHAADSSATSAAVAYAYGVTSGGNVKTQARSVASSYGFVDQANGTTVTVNQPPSSGSNKSNSQAIEVIISQPETRLFSALWSKKTIPVTARAVAVASNLACILTLDPTASSSFSQQGSVNSQLVNCSVIDDSNASSALSIGGSATLSTSFVGVVGGISGSSSITATQGKITGYHTVSDPYASVSPPSFSGCDQRNYSSHGTATLSPGVYCGGMSLGAGANITLQPGIYYLDQGSLTMNGSSTLTGTGVTIVFTSSTGNNYATATITGGATLNLTAPTSGSTAGIVLYGDRNMPTGTSFSFTGGTNQLVGGAVYFPKGAVSWAGNSGLSQKCTQVVADTIQMVGDSGFKIDCSGYGTKPIGSPATLAE
jgi:Flp pilus assembly protein TadG